MILLSESDKRKIKGLSLNTVSNGATIDEEKELPALLFAHGYLL